MLGKSTPHIVVFHLVRKANSIAAFENFIESYVQYKAGVEHQLVLIYKGFINTEEIAQYEALVKNLPHSYIFVKDGGYDLSAYFSAASVVQAELVCFLNSFSVIQSQDWLRKLEGNLAAPGVGLVGATGSWGTLASRPPKTKKTLWERLGADGTPFYIKIWDKTLNKLFFSRAFGAFPNPHIRSNAFLIKRSDFLGLRKGMLQLKAKNYFFESGTDSMTNQILQKYDQVLVVGADGRGYSSEYWPNSKTFWAESQENLMISDNQTRNYSLADLKKKAFYRKFAWGNDS